MRLSENLDQDDSFGDTPTGVRLASAETSLFLGIEFALREITLRAMAPREEQKNCSHFAPRDKKH